MIHNVTFMGREECLTTPVKKAVSKTHEYLSPSAVLEDTVSKTKEGIKFVSDYSPIQENLIEQTGHHINEEKVAAADKIAEAYKAAHGII